MFAQHRRRVIPETGRFPSFPKTKQQIKKNVIADLIAYLKIRGKK